MCTLTVQPTLYDEILAIANEHISQMHKIDVEMQYMLDNDATVSACEMSRFAYLVEKQMDTTTAKVKEVLQSFHQR